jgi:1-acyl-sn-glycerol-3-phosphate acyltransferase
MGDCNSGGDVDLELPTASALKELSEELDKKLLRLPSRVINEYGYDPWGYNPRWAKPSMMIMALCYRYWFRVESEGVSNLPPGRMLVIGNHAGNTFAWDAAMAATATFLEGNPPRALRGMAEYYLPTLPFFNIFMHRMGSIVGRPENARRLLEAEEAIIVMPEGQRGFVKPYSKRYQLQRFGYGFMRLALETRTPIVPVAIVGSEEQSPGIATSRALGKLIGAPNFPLTWTFPWLGPLGMIPFPVKFRIRFGAPMNFRGDHDDDDAKMDVKVEKVKGAIRRMLRELLRKRKSFWG